MANGHRPVALMMSAERLEKALEVVRSELGKAEKEAHWAGLSRHLATGAERTREFAAKLGESQSLDPNDTLIHVFTLRQLEITMSLISRLSGQMAEVQARLDHLEAAKGTRGTRA